LALPFSLPAQAWLFPKGEGAVTVSYQNTYVRDHVSFDGQAFDKFGDINSHSMTVDTDYSITDRLAVRVSLPYVFGKYKGPARFLHSLPVDDGDYHSTFQDFTTDLRYNVSQRPVVLTPFVRVVVPSHGYEYFAHAAVGRDLREYHIGINAGRRLNRRTFLQAQYSYAFVERVLDMSPNRSNIEAQVSYFLTPRLSLLTSMQWYYTYDGLEAHLDLPPLALLTPEQFKHHDQLGKSILLDGGAGFSFAATRKLEVFATIGRSVLGTNGHLHSSVFSFGFSHTFGTRDEQESASLGTAKGLPPPNQAIVCTCAKGR
jgi:hypothetical protein